MKIGFVGLGKLGRDVAEVISEHYDLIGYDINKNNGAKVTQAKSLKYACENRKIVFVAPNSCHAGIVWRTDYLKSRISSRSICLHTILN